MHTLTRYPYFIVGIYKDIKFPQDTLNLIFCLACKGRCLSLLHITFCVDRTLEVRKGSVVCKLSKCQLKEMWRVTLVHDVNVDKCPIAGSHTIHFTELNLPSCFQDLQTNDTCHMTVTSHHHWLPIAPKFACRPGTISGQKTGSSLLRLGHLGSHSVLHCGVPT